MKCTALKTNGIQCGANAMNNCDVCFRHDKTSKTKAIHASQKGGHSNRQYIRLGSPTVLKTPKDIQNLMEQAINSLWTGKMPAGNPAGSLGYLSKIFLEAYEKSELETRMEAIEKRLEQAKI